MIHRDLKPANIIVGKYGETLVVHWGLAKAVGHDDARAGASERTLQPPSASGVIETLPGSAMGTPAYMSPEQAAGDLAHLGARSDVYSLGATLYCLLTGKPPFSNDDVGAVIRAVQKGDFPPPRKLDPTIPRALEAVCLKAMAVRSEDRYASAREMVDDLDRWLADEPVRARPEPFTERARRWIRRNRTKVTTAAMVLVVTLLGLGVVLAIQTRANRELQAALDRETEARNSELAAKTKAETRLTIAQDAIGAFYSGVSEDVMLRQPQLHDLRKKLLETALQFYRRWEGETVADNTEHYMIMFANERVGDILSQIGSKEEALKAFQRIVDQPENREKVLKAKAYLKMARIQRQLGRPEDALRSNREARTRFEAIAKSGGASQRGDLGWCLLQIGSLQDEMGRTDEAMKVLEEARDIDVAALKMEASEKWIAHNQASTNTTIGNIHSLTGNLVEAKRSYEQSREIMERLVAEQPRNMEFRGDLARSYNNLGYYFTEAGQMAEALHDARSRFEDPRGVVHRATGQHGFSE